MKSWTSHFVFRNEILSQVHKFGNKILGNSVFTVKKSGFENIIIEFLTMRQLGLEPKLTSLKALIHNRLLITLIRDFPISFILFYTKTRVCGGKTGFHARGCSTTLGVRWPRLAWPYHIRRVSLVSEVARSNTHRPLVLGMWNDEFIMKARLNLSKLKERSNLHSEKYLRKLVIFEICLADALKMKVRMLRYDFIYLFF